MTEALVFVRGLRFSPRPVSVQQDGVDRGAHRWGVSPESGTGSHHSSGGSMRAVTPAWVSSRYSKLEPSMIGRVS
jgi:hypothetical protein